MSRLSVARRLSIVADFIESGALGAVDIVGLFKPEPDGAFQVALQRVRYGGIFLVWVNTDGSITHVRERLGRDPSISESS